MKFTTKRYNKMASGQKQSNQPPVSHRWSAGIVHRWLRAQGLWRLASQHTGDVSFMTQNSACPAMLYCLRASVQTCPGKCSCIGIRVGKSHSLGEVSKYFTAWRRTNSPAKRHPDEVPMTQTLGLGWVLHLWKGAQRKRSVHLIVLKSFCTNSVGGGNRKYFL
jgi:hypothetical protein